MKKLYFILIALLPGFAFAQTTYNVTLELTPTCFTPGTLNVAVGDTIIFTTPLTTPQVWPVTQSSIISTDDNYFDCGAMTQFSQPCKYVPVATGEDTIPIWNQNQAICEGVIYISGTGPIGVDPLKKTLSSKAYPNPFTNITTIHIEGMPIDRLEVVNIMGQIVYSEGMIGSTKALLDMSSVPNGIYFYRLVKDGAFLETQRLIKN